MSVPDTDRLLCWVDVETTGLDETKGAILEVGIILTDWTLRSWTPALVVRALRPGGWTDHRYHARTTGSGLLRVAEPGLGTAHDLAIWSCEGLPVAEVEAMARVWIHERCPENAPCGQGGTWL